MTKAYTIIARCGDIESQFDTYIPIVLPVAFTIAATPASVSGVTGGDVFISTYLEDDSNTLPITGAGIAFWVDGAGTLSTWWDVTDEWGMAYTTLTIPDSTAEGTTTVSARVGMTDIEASIDITINP
jgi:hypothetical protein